MIDKVLANDALSKPVFTISLDLELAWGFILCPKHEVLHILRSDPEQGRGAVNLLLKVLRTYNIPATWATVGHLFLSPGEGKELISREMPQFKEGWINWDFYNSFKGDPLYYGRDIVEKIIASPIKHENV